MNENEERRQNCLAHQKTTEALEKDMWGNGRPGIKDRVIKLEAMIWIVIVLLLGNGSLLGWTIKTVNKLSELTMKIEIQYKEMEKQNENTKYRKQSRR